MPNPISEKTWTVQGVPISYGNTTAGLGDAPSGYGADYDQMFAANPYRNQTYNKSFWQSIAEGLGFRTGYDKWREAAMNNAAEWDADVFALMNQNQYDSPEAMAGRERAAGINPDLLGIGDVAQSAGMRNDANGMPETGSDIPQALTVASGVCSTVLDIIPQAMSFASNLTALRGMQTDNDIKEAAFSKEALGAAREFFLEGLDEKSYKDAFTSGNWENVLEASKSHAKFLAENLFSSKRARKQYQLAYGMHARSIMGALAKYKSYDEYEAARKSLLSQRSSSFFSDDDKAMHGLLSAFLQPIESYQQTLNDINKRLAENRTRVPEDGSPSILDKEAQLYGDSVDLALSQTANQAAYEGAISPTGQAAAENAANNYTTQLNEIQSATDKLFADIMKNLGSHDNWWSKIAMALVGIARAQLMSGISMQFGRNKQYEVNGDTGVFTESGRSTVGFSF